ncbi:MAG TPA: hypothetical protein VFC35_00255 [Gemmatimonadaceae bacterium]|nr:hypothetical protein [Gemmatimonadaceae bacterium]
MVRVTIPMLIVPMILSALAVWVASILMWNYAPHHRNERRAATSHVMTFLVYLLISFFLAFIAHCTLTVGAETRRIWCVIGAGAGLAHAAGVTPAMWSLTPRSVILKQILDGIVYAIITGAIFVLLWPK